jgi:hypothetical protein
MKCETLNTMLVFAVGFCVVLDVLFAVRAVNGQRAFRTLSSQFTQSQTGLIQLRQLEALASETRAYNQQHPNAELTRALAELQTKSATR